MNKIFIMFYQRTLTRTVAPLVHTYSLHTVWSNSTMVMHAKQVMFTWWYGLKINTMREWLSVSMKGNHSWNLWSVTTKRSHSTLLSADTNYCIQYLRYDLKNICLQTRLLEHIEMSRLPDWVFCYKSTLTCWYIL